MSKLSSQQLLDLHGPLVLRLTRRMSQFRVDRLKAQFATKDFLPEDFPDGLSRYDEARALIAIVRACDGLSGVDAHGDAGEGERLFSLSVGHVLTEQDIKDIECLIADNNDAIGHEAEKWDEARQATLREIGGDALVAAAAARDEQIIKASVDKAMAKFNEMINTARPASTDS